MKQFKTLLLLAAVMLAHVSFAQEEWGKKFEQLGTELPTPNSYRSADGSPGPRYWQQQADYVIDVTINDETQVLTGSETITYHNNSPHTLKYLWVQLDQNVRAPGNMADETRNSTITDSTAAKFFASRLGVTDYQGGYKIAKVSDGKGNPLNHVINRTMMRVDLPVPLASGEKFVLAIDWSYNIYDRMEINGRGGYEYFPKDDNYAYTCAQWFPRMAAYDDYEGWQNKQFIGRGEFTLEFGNYEVNITVPDDHIVAATGELQNAREVLTSEQYSRLEKAKSTYDAPVFVVTQEEAAENEKTKSKKTETWQFKAQNVRDFAFASSRKYIWDAQAVKLNESSPLAMSFYPKEGNPLWERESTKAIKNTLEVYSERTFDYPYPVAISVNAANQGMEYPMICFNYGRPDENGEYSERVRDGNISVIVHEVGHNYFPMIVNSDERQWTWMDEGLNTFLEKETKRVRYPELDLVWGTPQGVVDYMKGDKEYIRPIMTNSEQVLQFGYNAYGKPSAALTVLREVVMGPELFDASFKEYANRWKFKRPRPADFFRTMEDASAVDLDWFWKGWFYTVDHVDVNLEEVKWFRMRNEKGDIETRNVQVGEQLSANADAGGLAAPEPFSLVETDDRFYGEFMNRFDDKAAMAKLADKNFYQLKLSNQGGLVTPLLIEFTFTDGTTEMVKIPAEIWRTNETTVTKVFYFDKQVANVVIDPQMLTGDTNTQDNVYPRPDAISKFDKFRATADESASANAQGTWGFVTDIEGTETTGTIEISGEGTEMSGRLVTERVPEGYELRDVSLKGNVLNFSFVIDNGDQELTAKCSVIIDGDLFKGKMNISGIGAYDLMGNRI